MELVQHIEETGYGMLASQVTAERKVSFKRDEFDASKPRHISAWENVP